jgi:SNF2 family DNA or RNA helicase
MIILVVAHAGQGKLAMVTLRDEILHKVQLRRTKTIVAADIKLPPLVIKVVEHETTPEEKDFYESIYKGACVKFNTFVQKGTMLHNYAVRSAPALGSGVTAGCVCGRSRVGAPTDSHRPHGSPCPCTQHIFDLLARLRQVRTRDGPRARQLYGCGERRWDRKHAEA